MKQFLNNWLARLRGATSSAACDLLVTTSTSVLRIKKPLGTFATQAGVVHQGRGLYYGLAPDPEGAIWVAARGNRVSDAASSAEERGRLIKLSSGGVTLGPTAPQPLRDAHGLTVAHNALWLACSYDDVIAIYSLASDSWTWWRPLPLDADAEPDRFHFNTLFFEGGLVWVLAHRRGPSSLMAFSAAEALIGKTTPPLETVELGQQAHNIWRQADGELCTCSSIEGCPLGSNGWRLDTGGFPRGVVQAADGWVVGISELKERSERDFSDARLRFYDTHWRLTDELLLPGVGMVLDIMAIPQSLTLPVVGKQPVVVN